MDAKVHAIGLIISCPLHDADSNCPYNKYRDIPLSELIETVNKIPHQELMTAYGYHQLCMRDRLKSNKAS